MHPEKRKELLSYNNNKNNQYGYLTQNRNAWKDVE